MDLLSRYVDVDEAFDLSHEQLINRVKSADAMIVRSGTKVRSDRCTRLLEGAVLHYPGFTLQLNVIANPCAFVPPVCLLF